jgi:hypothetical protein
MRALLLGLTGLLLASSAAEARMHHPYRAHRIVASASAPLDGFTQPAAAYSFRKLRSAYSGPALRIRRASDNAELDINFLGYVAGLGSPWDEAAANAHCATTTCQIVTIYDQSGNARHATQATPANQPALVFNCNGALPCASSTWAGIGLSSASVTWAAGLTSLSAVGRRTVGIGLCYFAAKHLNRIGADDVANTWWTAAFVGGEIAAAAADNVWHAGISVINGASSVLRVDAVETTGSVVVNPAAGAAGFNLGAASTTCQATEAILWDNYVLTPAERLALAENQKNYWMPLPLDAFVAPSGAYSFRKLKSTYSGPAIRIRRASDNLEIDINFLGHVPGLGSPWDEAAAAAHCAATSCFGVMWYDQSGLARNLSQPTAASQPSLVFNCNGSLPCWRATSNTFSMAGGSVTPATGVVSFSVVARRPAGVGVCLWFRQNNNVNRITSGGVANQWALHPTGMVAAATDNVWHAGIGVTHTTAGSSIMSIDGVETTGTTIPTAVAGSPALLGALTTTCEWDEVAYWDNYILTPAERTALIANQRSFWGTP